MTATAVSKFLDRGALPSGVAVRHHEFGIWVPVTWGELIASAKGLGGGLMSMAVSDGDVIGLLMNNHPKWIAADMAIQGTGAATLALDPSLDADVVVKSLESTGAVGVLCGDQEQFDKIDELRAVGRAPKLEFIAIFDTRGVRKFDQEHRDDSDVVLTFEQLAKRSASDEWMTKATHVEPSSAAVISNGVTLTHAEVLAAGASTSQLVNLQSSDLLLAQASFADPFERSMSLVGLLAHGFTVAIGEGGPLAQQELTAVQPTVFHAAPGFLDRTGATLDARIKSTRGLRKWALARGWRPTAHDELPIKRPSSLLRIIGLAALAASVAWLLLTPNMTDPKRILVLFALWIAAGLAAIVTGAAVSGPLRRQLGFRRTRVVVSSVTDSGASLLGGLGVAHRDRPVGMPTGLPSSLIAAANQSTNESHTTAVIAAGGNK